MSVSRIYASLSVTVLLAIGGCHSVPPQTARTDKLPLCAFPRPVANRTYMVFFDHHSTAIQPRSELVIREFASSIDRLQPFYSGIVVAVWPGKDTSEVTPQDRGLDLRRGQAVARLLHVLLPYAQTKVRPRGTTHLPVPTDILTPEPQNRSAYLLFLDGKQIRPFDYQSDCTDWLRSHTCGPDVDARQATVCKQVEKVAHEFQP